MTNEEALRKLLKNFAAGDLEGVLAYYDDNVEFDIQAPPGHATEKLSKGKDQLREIFAYNASYLDNHTYEIHHIMEDGDTTLARGYETATVRHSGKRIAFPVIAEHRWTNGKIVFWREYYDTAQFYNSLPK